MKRLAIWVVVAIAGCRATHSIDPADLPASAAQDEQPATAVSGTLVGLLPAGLEAIGELDIAALRERGAFDAILGVEPDRLPRPLADVEAAWGLDPFEDVDRLAIGVAEVNGAASLVVVARCHCDATLVAAAAKRAALRPVSSGDMVRYLGSNEEIALATSDTILYGDPGLVEAALRRIRDGSAGALDDSTIARLWQIATAHQPTVSFAVLPSPELQSRLRDAGLSGNASRLLIAVDVARSGDVRAAMTVDLESVDAASLDASRLRMALASFAEDPVVGDLGLRESLLTAPVTVDVRRVRVDYRISGAAVRRALATLRGALDRMAPASRAVHSGGRGS